MHLLGLRWNLPLHQDHTAANDGPLVPPAIRPPAIRNGPVNHQPSQPLIQPVIRGSLDRSLWHKTVE